MAAASAVVGSGTPATGAGTPASLEHPRRVLAPDHAHDGPVAGGLLEPLDDLGLQGTRPASPVAYLRGEASRG